MFHFPVIEFSNGGLFLTEETWIHPDRVIDSYEIIYVVSGTVSMEEDNFRYLLKKGDLFLLSPGHRHRGYDYSEGTTSFYWFHFTTDSLDTLRIRPGLVSIPEHYRFSAACKQLLHISNALTYPDYAVHSALLQFLSEISAAQLAAGTQGSALLSDISEYIRINSRRKLSVQDIADRFGYNSDYISALFRKNLHISLKRYINEQQVNAIKSLLVTTNLSVKELAAQTGWEDTNEFVHFFKYHAGVSPLKFRNMNNRTHMNNH